VGVIRIARRGYGFVDTPEGEYFVSRGHLRGAMDGDRVEVVRLRSLEARRRERDAASTPRERAGGGDGGRGLLGSVRRVLERAHGTVVGILRYSGGLGVVRPFNERIPYDIFIDHRPGGAWHAREGDAVVVRVTTYPSRIEAAQGYIEEVIGQEDDGRVGIELVIREHGFETVFSAAALEEAAAIDEVAAPARAESPEREGRRDLRDRFIFTIDPEDARDFDDALSVDFIDGQMCLGVHIADVSAHVAWDSALDLDARRRATSVYLPDRVIPMLPASLSDGLCSLRPGEDRLAFTVEMFMNPDGSVARRALYPSLIRSSARLSYDEAQRILDGSAPSAQPQPLSSARASSLSFLAEGRESSESRDSATSQSQDRRAASPPVTVSPVEPAARPLLNNRLFALNRLARQLTRRRIRRGSIEFESVEAKLVLDEDGAPLAVRLRGRTDATAIVEEAMILANEQVASYMLAQGAPMVYRIHDEPFAASIDELMPVLQEFGYARQGPPRTSPEIQAILEESAGRPEHALVSSLLLRAMKRAKYTPAHATHFGLASGAYTHFTSPIRRYPDLMAHRLLRYQLLGEPLPENMERQLAWICEHSSERERAAEWASREATALKLCEYLAPRVGECFAAVITAVNAAGLIVREDTTTAEGLIDREALADVFEYEPERYRYHDPASGRAYRLGQPLRVLLKGVDPSRSRLLFIPDMSQSS
jgi:ribonuclease R